MGRRSKYPPPANVIVQGLSDAKLFVEVRATYVCDITGEVMPMSTETLAQYITDNPHVITDYRKRIRTQRMIEEYLVAKRYTEQRDKALEIVLNNPKHKLAHNQMKDAYGRVWTIGKARSWRRL